MDDNVQPVNGLLDELVLNNPVGIDAGTVTRMRQAEKTLYGQFLTYPAFTQFPAPEKIEENDEEIMAKQKIVTMRDARAHHYEIFGGPDDEVRGQKEGILKYIENLGIENETDVSEWKISSFKNGKNLILEKNKINKIFFSLQSRAQLKKMFKPAKKSKYVKASEIEALSKKVPLTSNQNLVSAEQNLKTAENAVKYNQNYIEMYQREKVKCERMVVERQEIRDRYVKESAIHADPKPFAVQLKKLLKTGKVMLAETQPNNGIDFLTAPINKTFFCKEQATNTMVPLGQYLIKFRNTGLYWTITVKPGKDNIFVGRFFHPHNGGRMCWGAMGTPLEQAKRDGNLFDYIMTAYETLSLFEERDGYTSLYQFEEEYKKKLKEKRKQNGAQTKKQTQETAADIFA